MGKHKFVSQEQARNNEVLVVICYFSIFGVRRLEPSVYYSSSVSCDEGVVKGTKKPTLLHGAYHGAQHHAREDVDMPCELPRSGPPLVGLTVKDYSVLLTVVCFETGMGSVRAPAPPRSASLPPYSTSKNEQRP